MGDFEGDYDYGMEWDFERDDPVLIRRTKEQIALQTIANTVAKARMSPEQIVTVVQDICSRNGYRPRK